MSIDGHFDEDRRNKGFPNGLIDFFKNHEYEILAVNSFSGMAYTDQRDIKYFRLRDSHIRGSRGHRTTSRGTMLYGFYEY